jgi:hypothetical protein
MHHPVGGYPRFPLLIVIYIPIKIPFFGNHAFYVRYQESTRLPPLRLLRRRKK